MQFHLPRLSIELCDPEGFEQRAVLSFDFPVRTRPQRCVASVLHAVLVKEAGKFVRDELWSVVCPEAGRDAVSSEMRSQSSDDGGRCSSVEDVDLEVSAEVVYGH